MSPLALLFLLVSWTAVLGLAGWCIYRLLRSGRDARTHEGHDG